MCIKAEVRQRTAEHTPWTPSKPAEMHVNELLESYVALPEAAARNTVTSKAQVTIPKRVRDLLGIGPGSMIDFERAQDGRVFLVKVEKNARPNRLARLCGHAAKGLSAAEIVAMTRDGH